LRSKGSFGKIIALPLIFAMIALNLGGCDSVSVITEEEYPKPVVQNEEKKEKTETEIFNEDDLNDYLVPTSIPFDENGKYKMRPSIVTDEDIQKYKDDPKVIMAAVEISEAIYDLKTEGEFPKGMDLTEDQFNSATELLGQICALSTASLVSSEDYSKFTIMYFPRIKIDISDNGPMDVKYEDETDIAEASDYFGAFISEIENMMNESISAEDTETEKARKIYKYIVENHTVQEEEITEFSRSSEIELYKDDLVSRVVDRKLGETEVAEFYTLALQQLGIKSATVGAYGMYNSDNVSVIKDTDINFYNAFWNIISVDEKAYNCDLYLDILIYTEEKAKDPEYESPCRYFGLSDKTFSESFEFEKSNMYSVGIDAKTLYECGEDYKK